MLALGEAIGFQCCFCGASIAGAGTDPVALLIPLSDGGTQELRCHLACLQRALHPSVPLAVFTEAADAEPGAAADGGALFVSVTHSSPVPRRG